MLNIKKDQKDDKLTIALNGKLDTMTSPQLEEEISGCLEGISELVLDLAGLEYISSAGLRVILSMQKIMNRSGEMRVIHVNEVIQDIFDVTGFSDILTIA